MTKSGCCLLELLVVIGLLEGASPLFAESRRDIQATIDREGKARVIVMLKGNQWTAPTYRADDSKRKKEVKKVQDAVLSGLTEEDFRLIHKYMYSPMFAGIISQSGFEKLSVDERVESILLDIPVPPARTTP